MRFLKLGEVCNFVSGGTPSKNEETFWKGDIPWISGADIDLFGNISFRNHISQRALTDSSVSLVESGTLLLVTRTSVGKTAINLKSIAFSQDITALPLKNESVDVNYLRAFLAYYSPKLKSASRGATIQGVTREVIADIQVPVPDLQVQLQIAQFLERVNSLRQLRRQNLNQLDDLSSSLFDNSMIEILNNPENNWQTLGELIESLQLGLVRSSKEISPDLPVQYVRMNAISNTGELEIDPLDRTEVSDAEIEKYYLRAGDFLFNTRNSRNLVGKTAVVRQDLNAVFNNNIARIRFTNEAHPEYLAQIFQHRIVKDQLEQLKSGTTSVFAIYAKDLRSVKIPIPKLSVQAEIAKQMEEIHEIKLRMKSQLALLDEFYYSLQNRAFNVGL